MARCRVSWVRPWEQLPPWPSTPCPRSLPFVASTISGSMWPRQWQERPRSARNFDCTCFYVADRKALTETLSITPEYLRNPASASGAVVDFRDWHIPLGRRFRALKLWCVIRHYGVEGLQQMIRKHVDLTRIFADWLKADSRFELM